MPPSGSSVSTDPSASVRSVVTSSLGLVRTDHDPSAASCSVHPSLKTVKRFPSSSTEVCALTPQGSVNVFLPSSYWTSFEPSAKRTTTLPRSSTVPTSRVPSGKMCSKLPSGRSTRMVPSDSVVIRAPVSGSTVVSWT